MVYLLNLIVIVETIEAFKEKEYLKNMEILVGKAMIESSTERNRHEIGRGL